MTLNLNGLAAFGWSNHYHSQLDSDELEQCAPVRVVAVHRNRLEVASPDFDGSVPPFSADNNDESAATIGDWLLLDSLTHTPQRLLARKSLFKRKAAGLAQRIQLIAANIETLFIVTSCNDEFNVARLEQGAQRGGRDLQRIDDRMLALGRELQQVDAIDIPVEARALGVQREGTRPRYRGQEAIRGLGGIDVKRSVGPRGA